MLAKSKSKHPTSSSKYRDETSAVSEKCVNRKLAKSKLKDAQRSPFTQNFYQIWKIRASL